MTSRRRQLGMTLSFGASLSLVIAQTLIAQTVINACYNNQTGVLYVIDPSGTSSLRTDCANQNHVPLSFVDAEGADHGGLNGLGDDDHPHYLENGDPAAGDLGGTYPDPNVVALQGNAVDAAAPTDGQVLGWDGASSSWKPTALPSNGGNGGSRVYFISRVCPAPQNVLTCFVHQSPELQEVTISPLAIDILETDLGIYQCAFSGSRETGSAPSRLSYQTSSSVSNTQLFFEDDGGTALFLLGNRGWTITIVCPE